jgi:hypothetical protein
MRHVWSVLVFAVFLAGRANVPVEAAELQERTLRAYGAYFRQVYEAFNRRVQDGNTWWTAEAQIEQLLRRDGVAARPARQDGIIGVPGGLVHHWIGVALVPNVDLAAVMKVSQAYGDYATIYGPVIAAQVLDRDRDTYRVRLRIKEGARMVSAVLDIWSVVQYGRGDRHAFAFSESREIRQVDRAGRPDERLLPAGRDSGYLWRASTFTRYLERDEGVYIELETLGLSRELPPLLGWLIEPIARRLGRASVETSLKEFSEAISKSRTSQ